MKALHVITRLIRGGAQANTLATAALHRQRGIDARIVHGPTPDGPEGSLVGEARARGVPLVELAHLVRDPDPLEDLRALSSLIGLFRSERPDLVHTHTSKAGFLGRLAARLAPVPAVVHTPHGHVFHSYYGPLTTRLYVRLERSAARWADALVALTPRERDEHLDYAIGDERSWRVIPSGIDHARFAPTAERRAAARRRFGAAPGEFAVGCVARLAPVKGPDVLLRAFPLLLGEVPGALAVLLGDGEQRSALEALARSLGIRERVRFLGHLADPAPLFCGLDALAVPSRNEGMGRVVLEAAAAQVPLVASAVGGLIDLVIDGETGLLVPPDDPPRLAAALARLAARPERSRALAARAALGLGEAYSERAMAARLAELYDSLARRPL